MDSNWKNAATVGAGVGAGIAVVMVASPLVLAPLGFKAAGVGAGTIAATYQSSLGGYIAAGSLFSLFQSAGATGAVLFSASTTAAVAGAVGLTSGVMYKLAGVTGTLVVDATSKAAAAGLTGANAIYGASLSKVHLFCKL